MKFLTSVTVASTPKSTSRWGWEGENGMGGVGEGKEGLNNKKKIIKKKKKLVLPSGGLRGLCEMRWGGQSRSPWTGGVHSTKITSATGPRVLAVSAEAEGLSEPWRLNIPSHL